MGARVLIGLVAVLVAGACEKRSELYCGKHPDDLANCPQTDAGIDAPTPCMDEADCTPAAPLCEPGAGICVGCLTDIDCAGDPNRALCDPETYSCRSCIEHADCASRACLPDGTCGDDDTVIYVSEGGADTNPCTVSSPCATILRALPLVTDTRRFVKLSGALVSPAITIGSRRVILLSDPATTLRGADPVLKIQKSLVEIHDLTIDCGGAALGGIKTEMDSTTTLRRVTVRGCGKLGVEGKGGFLAISRSLIAHNAGGGITTDGSARFSITNTFIYRNGTAGSARGGVTLGATTTDVRNRFEFNTVVDNQVKAGNAVAGGVACAAGNLIDLANNVIARNTSSTGLNPNTVGGCGVALSLVVEDDIMPLEFVSPDAEPFDYHIGPGSSARDTAPDGSSVTEDFDGHYRPQGLYKDYGADEYRPGP
jgi:hypothetical protein